MEEKKNSVIDGDKHVLAMFLNEELFWMNNKTIIEFGFCIIWRIMELPALLGATGNPRDFRFRHQSGAHNVMGSCTGKVRTSTLESCGISVPFLVSFSFRCFVPRSVSFVRSHRAWDNILSCHRQRRVDCDWVSQAAQQQRRFILLPATVKFNSNQGHRWFYWAMWRPPVHSCERPICNVLFS